MIHPASAILILSLCIVTTRACKEEALFAVEDTFEGVLISTFHPPTVIPDSQASQRLTIPGHLSQECGHKFSRCQNPFRETFRTNGVQQTVIFIPLVDGLAVVGLSLGQITLHTILRTIGAPLEISCSPSTVYKILDGYFTVCTNQTTNFVSVFEVQLNKSSLSSTQLTFPTSQITIPPFVGNVSNASNFVHIELDRSHEYIVFAVGTIIYFIRPFLYAIGPFGNGVPSTGCDRITALVHQQGTEIYAYCTEHFFTYDIGEENWLVQDSFARRGLPYRCPRQEMHLSVFTDHIEYTIDGLIENVELQGSTFSSGVCFGNSTQSYFAFRDKNAGVFVLDLQTSEMAPISTSACRDDCYPLSAVDSRYLIVREDNSRKVLVLDYLGQSLSLIEALYTSPALATVLMLECPANADITDVSTGPTVAGPTTSVIVSVQPRVESSYSNKKKLIVVATSIVVPVAVILIIVVGLVSLAVVLVMATHRRKLSGKPPLQEVGVPVQDSSNVGLSNIEMKGVSLPPSDNREATTTFNEISEPSEYGEADYFIAKNT